LKGATKMDNIIKTVAYTESMDDVKPLIQIAICFPIDENNYIDYTGKPMYEAAFCYVFKHNNYIDAMTTGDGMTPQEALDELNKNLETYAKQIEGEPFIPKKNDWFEN
jgi:hypothetical protein